MRKLLVAVTAAAAMILLVGSLAWKADAQTSRGATNIPVQSQNLHAYSTNGVRRIGTLLPCGIYQAVRSAPLLVRAVRRAVWEQYRAPPCPLTCFVIGQRFDHAYPGGGLGRL